MPGLFLRGAKSLMPADGNIVSAWGYAQTIASLVIALLMPLLGSIADVQGMKIKFFLGFFGTGVVTCCAMALPLTWLPFLVVDDPLLLAGGQFGALRHRFVDIRGIRHIHSSTVFNSIYRRSAD